MFSTFNTSYAVCYNINSKYYATPDLRNYIIKGFCNSTTNDYNVQYRYALNNPYILGYFTGESEPGLGSYQYDMILGHNHLVNVAATGGPSAFIINSTSLGTPSGYSNGLPTLPFIQETGTGQNDVKNVYLNYYIKY